MIFFDTESMGFYGPTTLIQWGKDKKPTNIHQVWQEKAGNTVKLIEYLMGDTLVGYNVSHDSWQLGRLYNTLVRLPQNEVPRPIDFADEDGHFDLCIKPKDVIDLLIYGKKTEFQSILNQKEIRVKKVPKLLIDDIVRELYSNVNIPDIYFKGSTKGYNWKIIFLHLSGEEITPEEESKEYNGLIPKIKRDPDFVNLKLTFSPTAQLKAVISEITGKDVVTFEDLEKLPKVEEFEWRPFHNAWLDVSRDHIWAWTNDPRRIEYAKNDVEYLRILYDYFKQPKSDNDSRLAWGIGQMFGHGYAINIGKVEDRLSYIDSKLCDLDINVNAPRQMLKLLHDNCLPIERPFIKDTRSDTLKNIIKNDLSCKHVAEKILNARHDLKEKDLLNKIKLVKRLHPMYKAVGTKSNRMSGGSENYIKSSGSINVQGIKKGDSIRSLFKLADEGYILCGGDFDAFEVSIADAVYDDEQLRTDLLSGKKIHGLFAEEIYGIPYDEIYLHKDENENDPKGWYGRGKKAVFAFFYGANYQKIASVMGISEEEAQKGLINLKRRYPGIERAQVRAFDNLSALRQPDGIGTKVIWKDPKMFAESLLGFRRDFTLEFNIIKSIFNLSNKLSKDFGKEFTVVRRDRMQTGGGAARSALYAAAFNLQSYVIRAGINHEIQSTGGEITKEVQGAIWEVQPIGISQFLVLPLNMHDEIMCPCKPEVVGMVEKIVYREINRLKSIVPLLGMKWKSNLDSWSNK